jgi:ribosomal protein S6--L-glutamate ligase
MKLALLSRAPKAYSTQRLKAAALQRGHDVRVLNTLRFGIDLAGDEPDLQYRGRRLSDYDAILPRIGASITYFGTAVVRQFEQMDVYTPNTANGIANARDKLRATQILSRHHIGMPATTFVRNRGDVRAAIDRVGGAPVVIKLLEGTQGIGVILAPEVKIAEAIIETLQSTNQNVLIQRFVSESRGRDIRALVVGDRVVAAMRRTAQGDEFRSNVHRGGTVAAVTLSPEYEQAAVRSAQIMGLRVAGVDMLEGDDGPLVMEVNSSPGLQGIEAATQARSSTTSRTRWRSPRSTCGSAYRCRPATASPRSSCTTTAVSSARRSARPSSGSATSPCSPCTAERPSSRTRATGSLSKRATACCASESSTKCAR